MKLLSSQFRLRFIAIIAAACALGALTARAQSYWFTDLSTYTGLAPGYVLGPVGGINNRGTVVGWAGTCCTDAAVRLSGGVAESFASLGPAHSAAGLAINNQDDIVGWMDSTGAVYHAFHVWPASAGSWPQDLHPAFITDPLQSSTIQKINDRNEFIGEVTSGGPPRHVYSYFGNTSGVAWSFAPILGSGFIARDLNNRKEVVGTAKWGGLIYSRGAGTATYLYPVLGDMNNTADTVNDSIEVAGTVTRTTGYLYSGGTARFFGRGRIQQVADINASGDVVGTTTPVDWDGRAFLYVKSTGALVDLSSASGVPSTWTLVTATGINDYGDICGMARRLSTPNDHTTNTYVYAPYKLTALNWDFFPVVP